MNIPQDEPFEIGGIEIRCPAFGIFRVKTKESTILDRIRKYLVNEGFRPWIVSMDD